VITKSKRKQYAIETITTILLRSGGRCEAQHGKIRCHNIANQIHHLQYRSKCGDDSIGNLIHICHDCHYTIHNVAPSIAPWVMQYKRRYIKK